MIINSMRGNMFKLIAITLFTLPVLGFANIYSCKGAGYNLVVSGSPVEVYFIGPNIESVVKNVKISTSFDTVYSGNIPSQAISFKLTIKDSSFGAPGDLFKGILLISSSQGIKEHSDLECIRGND